MENSLGDVDVLSRDWMLDVVAIGEILGRCPSSRCFLAINAPAPPDMLPDGICVFALLGGVE